MGKAASTALAMCMSVAKNAAPVFSSRWRISWTCFRGMTKVCPGWNCRISMNAIVNSSAYTTLAGQRNVHSGLLGLLCASFLLWSNPNRSQDWISGEFQCPARINSGYCRWKQPSKPQVAGGRCTFARLSWHHTVTSNSRVLVCPESKGLNGHGSRRFACYIPQVCTPEIRDRQETAVHG